jgi:hypothetical protein
MNCNHCNCWTLTVAAFVLAATIPGGATAATIVGLDVLDGGVIGENAFANAISDNGQVIVGTQGLFGSRATRWTQATGQTDLGKIAKTRF